MAINEERGNEDVTRQLRAWELLERELSIRLTDDAESQEMLRALRDPGQRAELLSRVTEADPENGYLRMSESGRSAEQAARELDKVLDRLQADPELAEDVKAARQGAEAVTLGSDLAVIADLTRDLAFVAAPVAMILAARIKRIGSVEFYEGVPKELVNVMKAVKDRLPGTRK